MSKQFCGNGKIINTKYGNLTKLNFSAKDLQVLTENLNNGWVSAVLKEKKNKQEGKPTHYLEIDNWKPEQKTRVEVAENKIETYDRDDLPF